LGKRPFKAWIEKQVNRPSVSDVKRNSFRGEGSIQNILFVRLAKVTKMSWDRDILGLNSNIQDPSRDSVLP